MSTTTDATTLNCSCDVSQPWQVISNVPRLSTLQYRVGDFLTFRQQLLLPLPDEQELLNWRPSAKGDLALQMVEWWAYLADILTFYNERIANQDYLRTADMEESVKRLIRLLGYRPRPGIGAQGLVAALMSNPSPMFTLPQGFPIQSKPGPGKQPQIFEVSTDTLVSYPDVVNVELATPVPLISTSPPSVLLKGVITSIKANDELLLLENSQDGSSQSSFAVVTVKSIPQQEKDPRGHINTRVTFVSLPNLPNIPTDDYHLMKSTQSAHLWPYNAASSVVLDLVDSRVHLAAITRQIKVGDPVLFESSNNSPQPQLVSVTTYSEQVWYANTGNPNDPTQIPGPASPPTSPPEYPPPIPIPHTVITFTPALTDHHWSVQSTMIRYAWQDVGQLISTPSTALSGTSTTVKPMPPATFPPPPSGQNLNVMLEDVNGQGTQATGQIDNSSGNLNLTELNIPANSPLRAPLRLLFDLLPVTRGKTVSQEILGSGDPTIAGQEFVLQKSPLTYLLSSASTSGGNYTSTLKIMVNNIAWQEVPSFYNQPSNAQIFVTREDENNMTHVQFGDGINGARLPSGLNNVIATYRYGSGADSPDVGQLTVLTQAWPNLKAIRNPVAVSGGADPDSAKKIRQYAPQSVLTFGRAISADDYETIAAQAPGVARASVYWAWNPEQQRPLATVYVGDDASAVGAAQTALSGTADPNRPIVVLQAVALPMTLHLSLRINPLYRSDIVEAAVTAALLDDNTGLFGINVIRIGQVIYQSQIFAACMDVAGVQAVNILDFSIISSSNVAHRVIECNPVSQSSTCQERSIRYCSGQDGFFQLLKDNLFIDTENA